MKKLLFLFCLSVFSANAQLRLAGLFTNHAVLQSQKPIPIWGWASPNEKVTVSFDTQTVQTTANSDGKWIVKLAPIQASNKAYSLSVKTKTNTINLEDMLVGEVWLCSGQSNMEWAVKDAINFKEEKKDANFPQIRHFFVAHDVQMKPQTDLKSGKWTVCSAQTVGDFTAVGFFFARDVSKKLQNVPIGLLHSSWGGSQVEGWISKDAMQTSDVLKEYAQTMPQTWEQADTKLEENIKLITIGDKNNNPSLEDENRYFQASYDCSKWFKSSALGQWDWKGIWSFRGNGFMAKTIDVPATMATQPTILSLAQNDNNVEVYINGKRINIEKTKEVIKINLPPNTWQVGQNKLVIKLNKMLEPEWFGVGLKGNESDLFLGSADQNISLADNNWGLMPSFAEAHQYYHSSNNVGTTIFNGMIAPLVPYSIRGVLWYQGESNAGRAFEYRKSFALMINDWRTKWGDDFSFYFAQLSSYGKNASANEGSNWAELREAQTLTLALPKTGMAVITDIGNPTDIHPTNKQDVGKRLAGIALAQDYGQNVISQSPMYESIEIKANLAVVSLKNVPNGLVAKDKFGYVRGLEIAGNDKVFYYAQAKIVGNKLVVESPKVPNPVAVRYAWTDSPDDSNVFSSEGLPLCPFRTDNWKGITEEQKFR